MNASTARILVIDDDAVFADVLARFAGGAPIACREQPGRRACQRRGIRADASCLTSLSADDCRLCLNCWHATQARVLLLTGARQHRHRGGRD
ncbi:MAG: hypothetical protein IPH76_18845 [Xanthomonadales bacterium]|nr:hypothetical protein [Xanthomonadales bacterium]